MSTDPATLPMGKSSAHRTLDVGLLCHGWFPDAGGVESHTRDLARELLARGHRVHALCLDYSPEREAYSVREEEVEGVLVRRMAYLYQDQRALADVVENRRAEDVLLAWLAEHPMDLVHVHHLTGWGLGALRAIHDVGRPCVMTLHDYWALCPRGQMMRPEREVCARPQAEVCATCLASTWGHLMPSMGAEARAPGGALVEGDQGAARARTAFALECLAHPERLVTPSRRARAVFVRAGLPRERVAVVENGVDVEGLRAAVAAVREQQGHGPRNPGGPDSREGPGLRIGALGTVLPSKGQLELAKAFLAAQLPAAVLEVHGALPPYHGDSNYTEELQELARRHPQLEIRGAYNLDELPRILAGLDAVVANSRWEEVFGLTVREAAAVGLPVLVSDAGDLASVAQGGTAGEVVNVDDREGWIAAFTKLAGDADARRRWREAPRRVHTTAAMVDELLVLYAAAISAADGQGGEETTAVPQEMPTSEGRSLLWRLLHRRRN